MQVRVVKIPKEEWALFSEKSHLIVFKENKPVDFERIDFALVAEVRASEILGYVTCRETDSHTLYWQFGGAYPRAKNSSLSFLGYTAFVNWTKQHYARVHTLIENNNIVMLKMAMKAGFRIIGIRNFNNHILLEHAMEFDR